MQYRPLGNTGLKVSALTLGTVELGLDYGFKGSAHYSRPSRADAVKLVRHSIDRGVNLIDTARAYGDAESVVGEAVSESPVKPMIATKVAITAETKPEDVFTSVETSLRELRAGQVELLQIHSATLAALANRPALDALLEVRERGLALHVAASIYTVDEALASLSTDWARSVQVPFNMLDQRMADRVFPVSTGAGRGILVRSAFLRGVLTPAVDEIPAQLATLGEAAHRALALLGTTKQDLASWALRFVLSFDAVSSVIAGVRTIEEVDANIDAAELGPWPMDLFARRPEFAVNDPIVSPANWQGLI